MAMENDINIIQDYQYPTALHTTKHNTTPPHYFHCTHVYINNNNKVVQLSDTCSILPLNYIQFFLH